jgi:FixJ family two-component response regulator
VGLLIAEVCSVAFLIVEDDSAVADALGALLAGAGHDTRVYSSAERLFDSGPPTGADTVIVDLGLPGVSGAALLRWLTALADPPKIVVISGKSSSVIERETQDITRLQVLRKPPAADWLEAMTA